MARYKEGKEVMLYGITGEIRIPEIKVRYNRGKTHTRIKDSKDTYQFLKKVLGSDISLQEHVIVLFLDINLNVLGYYKHTIGTPISAIFDIPMIMGVAVKALARAIIFSHNHPSGNRMPSEIDRKVTRELVKATKTLQIRLLDHIIVTSENGYYSFAEEGDTSLDGINKKKINTMEEKLRQEIFRQLARVTSTNAPKVYKMLQTESGYRNVEQRVINMVIRDRITPSACVPQIENEL